MASESPSSVYSYGDGYILQHVCSVYVNASPYIQYTLGVLAKGKK